MQTDLPNGVPAKLKEPYFVRCYSESPTSETQDKQAAARANLMGFTRKQQDTQKQGGHKKQVQQQGRQWTRGHALH